MVRAIKNSVHVILTENINKIKNRKKKEKK